MKLQGIFIPVAVPFDHRGELYPVKVQHNFEKWNRTAVSGYVVCGAESRYLSSEEKIRLWEWAAQYAAPEKLLIANAGMPSVAETVTLINHAATLRYRIAVIDAPAGPPELQATYFHAVADRAKIPIIASGSHAKDAAQHPNVIGSAGCKVSDLPFVGDCDASMAEAFAAGASAVFAQFANAAPYVAISIWEAHRTREPEAALDWQKRIAPAVALFEKYGPAGVKHAMDLNGYYGGLPRLPLVGLTPQAKKEIEQALDGIKG